MQGSRERGYDLGMPVPKDSRTVLGNQVKKAPPVSGGEVFASRVTVAERPAKLLGDLISERVHRFAVGLDRISVLPCHRDLPQSPVPLPLVGPALAGGGGGWWGAGRASGREDEGVG